MKLQLLIREGEKNVNGIIWPEGTLSKIVEQINSAKRPFNLTTQKPPCDLQKFVGVVNSAELNEGVIWIEVKFLYTQLSVFVQDMNSVEPLKVDSCIATEIVDGVVIGNPKLIGLFLTGIYLDR